MRVPIRTATVRPLVALTLLFSACGTEGRLASTTVPAKASVSPVATPTPARSPASSSPSPQASPSPAASSPEEKGAFVSAANAVCREFSDRIDGLASPEVLDDLPPWLRGFIAIVDDLQSKFRALTPPRSDAAAVDGYLDGNDAQRAALAKALPEVEAAAADEDAERADAALDEAFETFGRIAAEQDPWARSYGLRDCVDADPSSNISA